MFIQSVSWQMALQQMGVNGRFPIMFVACLEGFAFCGVDREQLDSSFD